MGFSNRGGDSAAREPPQSPRWGAGPRRRAKRVPRSHGGPSTGSSPIGLSWLGGRPLVGARPRVPALFARFPSRVARSTASTFGLRRAHPHLLPAARARKERREPALLMGPVALEATRPHGAGLKSLRALGTLDVLNARLDERADTARWSFASSWWSPRCSPWIEGPLLVTCYGAPWASTSSRAQLQPRGRWSGVVVGRPRGPSCRATRGRAALRGRGVGVGRVGAPEGARECSSDSDVSAQPGLVHACSAIVWPSRLRRRCRTRRLGKTHRCRASGGAMKMSPGLLSGQARQEEGREHSTFTASVSTGLCCMTPSQWNSTSSANPSAATRSPAAAQSATHRNPGSR